MQQLAQDTRIAAYQEKGAKMMILIEKEKLEQFQKDIDLIKNEIEKQNRKTLEIIDAIENVFKENRELAEEGFPTADEDSLGWDESEDYIRRAVIENIEYGIKTRVKEILYKYRGIKDYESKKWKCGNCKWWADNDVCVNGDSSKVADFTDRDFCCECHEFKEVNR